MSSYYEKLLATGEVKCIDEEIPFEIPKGWEWCRLNDLALYRKGPFGSSLTKSMFVAKSTQSIKVYEQKNAIQKDCTLGDYYISKEKFETMQSFVVKPNDIIVSCAGTIGETYLLPSDAPVGIINQALMRVTLFDLNMVEYWQVYFAYMLLNEVQMKGSGSAIKNIPPFEYLKAVLVPIPPLSEQNRLVERYNILLSLIGKYELEANKLNCLNQKVYDKLKKSVLQEAIRGKLVPQLAEEGSAQDLLEQIKLEKQKLAKEGKLKKSALTTSTIFRGDDNKYYTSKNKDTICIDDEIPFEIPDSWVWVRFGTIMINRDRERIPLSVAQRQFLSKRYDYYGASGVIDKVDRYLFDKELLLIGEDGANLLNRSTPIAFIAKGKYWVNNHAHVLDVYDGVMLKYIALYINSISLVPYVTGTAQPKMNQEKMNSVLIALPPQKEQQRIVAQIEKLFEQLH